MDGFFTDEEIPSAVAFVQQKFGSLPSHPRVAQLFAWRVPI